MTKEELKKEEIIFCNEICLVPNNGGLYGCQGRPRKYMKECPRLKAFNKRKVKE